VLLHESIATITSDTLGNDFPAVSLNWPVEAAGRDSVMPDEEFCLAEIAQRLWGLGHRRLAFVINPGTRHGRSVRLRSAAMRKRFPNLIELPGDTAIIRAALLSQTPPTALISYSSMDELPAVLRAVMDLGLAVPDDVSLACCDRAMWSELLHPELTSVVIPIIPMCTWAVERLVERIANPRLVPMLKLIPTNIEAGRTCGPVRRQAR
jgi:DNA-binding LacI/PurR family transcriptional regulator